MSTAEFCQTCRTPQSGEDFCLECFAPRIVQAPIFTRAETTPAVVPARAPRKPGQPAALDLRQVQYRAPSWFTRFQMRSRGAIVSLMVGSFFLISAAYFWTGHVREQVSHQYELAQAAVRKGDYPTALGHYQSSQALHQQIFDREGQALDLIEQSRCLSAQNLDEEALVRLGRASLIAQTPDVALATARIHRHMGLQALASARSELELHRFQEAQAQALTALTSLDKGDGSPSQIAAAHRVAALASAKLGHDDEAERQLDEARTVEGSTAANRALGVKLVALAAQHRQDRELALKRQKQRQLAEMARVRARNRATSSAPPALSQVYEPSPPSVASYSYSSYSGYSSPRVASHALPAPSYPTYHRPKSGRDRYGDDWPSGSSEPAKPTRVPSHVPPVSIPAPPGFRF